MADHTALPANATSLVSISRLHTNWNNVLIFKILPTTNYV